jgi:hypothetical protein
MLGFVVVRLCYAFILIHVENLHPVCCAVDCMLLGQHIWNALSEK